MASNNAQGVESVGARHIEVQQGEVEIAGIQQFHCLVTGACVTEAEIVVEIGEEKAHPLAKHLVIVDQQYVHCS